MTFCFSFWTSASQVLLGQALLWPYKVPKAGQTSLPSCHTSFISLDYAFVQDSLPYPKNPGSLEERKIRLSVPDSRGATSQCEEQLLLAAAAAANLAAGHEHPELAWPRVLSSLSHCSSTCSGGWAGTESWEPLQKQRSWKKCLTNVRCSSEAAVKISRF